MVGQRQQQQRQELALCACLLLACLLRQSAAVLLSSRPGNVLMLLLTDCAKYQDWQTIAAAYAWRHSKQQGSFVRVAACDQKDTKNYDKKMLDYVQTHMAPMFSYNKELNDWYAAYNKPGVVIDYLAHHDPKEEYVVLLDSDMLLRKPFVPEQLNVSRGSALAAHYDYLKGVDNDLALRHVPYIAPRNDTLAGPAGRRGDRVGGPYYMHKDDLKRLAPAWLNWTRVMRTDMEAYKDSGDTAAKKHGDRIWIAEMYGYAFGAANLGIWHRWSHDFMLYPSYTPSYIPHVMHYGLIYHVNDWTFDKHYYFHFDAHKCPPWDLSKEKPEGGIFPPPPHPDKLSKKDYLSRYKELLSVWVVSLVNAALCDYHVRNCPPSPQLTEVCNTAFKLHYDVEQDLKAHELRWDCTDHNNECDMWAKRGECEKSKAYMKEHCALACKHCTPSSPPPKEAEDLAPVTVEALMKEIGIVVPEPAIGNTTSSSASSPEAGAAAGQAASPSPAPAASPAAAAGAGKPTPAAGTASPSPAAAASPSAAVAEASPEAAAMQQQQHKAELQHRDERKPEQHDGAAAQEKPKQQDEEAAMRQKYPASTLGYAALVKRCAELQDLSDQAMTDCVKAASLRLAYPGVLKPLVVDSSGSEAAAAAGGGSSSSSQADTAAKLQGGVAGSAQDLASLHAIHLRDHHRIEDMLSKQMTGPRGGLSFLEQAGVVAVVLAVAWWGYGRVQQFRQARAKLGHSRSE